MIDHAYFEKSHTILAFTNKNRVWQSNNEGFSWHEVVNGAHIVAMTMHSYARDRAYLITESRTVHYTTDKGTTWNKFSAPADPNGLGIPLLDFHPLRSDWLIWTGQLDCGDSDSSSCRAAAYMTKDNGRNWSKLDEYVRVCSWGRDKKLRIDEKVIFCESYRDKKGSQRAVYQNNNPLRLVAGDYFYSNKKTLFENIVGFATFEEYMVVAEVRLLPLPLLFPLLHRFVELSLTRRRTPCRSRRTRARSGSRCRSTARRSRSPASRPTCSSRTRCVLALPLFLLSFLSRA